MTATTAPAPPRAPRSGGTQTRRMLRLELRRNTMIWLLPLIAAVFWLDTYRVSMADFPVWGLRGAVLLDRALKDFAPFSAGVGAWMGSRDGRRGAVDLVRVTARPGWLRQGITLTATACWVMAAYLGCVAILYGVTAGQGAWGSPAWWPVAVGAAGVAATCALGFAAGAFWPSRFTAPLAAVGVEVLMLVGTSLDGSHYGFLTPGAGNLTSDTGSFYPYLPDQAIDQVIFLSGVTIAVVGILGLAASGGGRLLRGGAAIVTAAGLVGTFIAVGLAGTAQQGAEGVNISALHDAANDRPIPYTPVCGGGPVPSIPMCVNPAFKAYIPQLDSTFAPVFREVAGLPGAPVRVNQISAYAGGNNTGGQLSGSPPVYDFAVQSLGPHGIAGIQEGFVVVFIAGNNAANGGTAAQQAVWLALLDATGNNPDEGSYPAAVTAAANRFAALSPGARRGWLAAHLTELRADRITVEQIP